MYITFANGGIYLVTARARTEELRADAIKRLRELRTEVRAQNQDLTAEQAEELADRISHDMIDDLADAGIVSFDRDRR
jgi:hypothetical protein